MTRLLLLPTAVALLAAAHSVSSFAPSLTNSARPTSSLQAKTLEGRTLSDSGALKPCTNFLLVKVNAAVDTTDSGILLSSAAKIEKTEGRVISVGPGKTHPDSGQIVPMPVEEGDGVVYGQFDGTILDYDGNKHALIRDDDILVKYSGEKLTVEGVNVCNENVLVLADETDEETSGGLLLAAPSKDGPEARPSTGTVVKVGPGRMASDGTRIAMTVQEGDRVKFRDFAGFEADIEGREYSVVKMPEILAKF